MADASIPTVAPPQALSAAAEAEAIAPNMLSGWTAFQREVNTVLPMALRRVAGILTNIDRLLGG